MLTTSLFKKNLVLRMLSNYVGEDQFLKGVSLYLKKKSFGTSVTKDLWEAIAIAAGKRFVCTVSLTRLTPCKISML